MQTLGELDAKTNSSVLAKARKTTRKEGLNNKLGILREKYGIKQSKVPDFLQPTVSKLKNYKVKQIFASKNYLDSLGIWLDITSYPENSAKRKLLLCL